MSQLTESEGNEELVESVATTEERRATVSRLRARKFSLRAIASKVGVSVATVHKDLVKARELWQAEAGRHYEEHVSEVLAELDAIAAEAYAAWDRSIGQDVVTTEKRTQGGVETTTRTKSLAGDPRFLVVLERLTAQKVSLLTGLKGEAAGGRTLAEFLASARSSVDVEFYERGVKARVSPAKEQ